MLRIFWLFDELLTDNVATSYSRWCHDHLCIKCLWNFCFVLGHIVKFILGSLHSASSNAFVCDSTVIIPVCHINTHPDAELYLVLFNIYYFFNYIYIMHYYFCSCLFQKCSTGVSLWKRIPFIFDLNKF
jgi:hypothetical protein